MHKKLRLILASIIAFSFVLSSFSAISAFADMGAAAVFGGLNSQFMANIGDWGLNKGDWLLINVEENTLQFVSRDNKTASWKYQIGSGEILPEGETMCYLGRCYDPRTPVGSWEILSKTQQSWYNVFGTKEADEQLFLRLYEVDGEARNYTNYGIHTTPLLEKWFTEKEGFASWGCVLTDYTLLKKIEELYHLNDKVVKVVTTKGDIYDVLTEI